MGALDKYLSRQLLRVRFSLIYILDLSLGQWFIILVFAGDAEFAPRNPGRDDIPTGLETDSQTSGIASCGLQSDVSEVVHSRSRNWELVEQAFVDGNNHVQMRNLLVLFLIGSMFWVISSAILLPLLRMRMRISLFICVALSVRWKNLSC